MNNKKTKWQIAGGLALLALALSGCGQSAPEPEVSTVSPEEAKTQYLDVLRSAAQATQDAGFLAEFERQAAADIISPAPCNPGGDGPGVRWRVSTQMPALGDPAGAVERISAQLEGAGWTVKPRRDALRATGDGESMLELSMRGDAVELRGWSQCASGEFTDFIAPPA